MTPAIPAGAAPPQASPMLDLALRLETSAGDPLPSSLEGLLNKAGVWAAASLAEQHWQALLAGWLAQLLPELPDELRSEGYSLGLLLTDDASIASLNTIWRHRNEPTDVLSFAAQESGLEDALPFPLPSGLLDMSGLVEEGEAQDNEEMASEERARDDLESQDMASQVMKRDFISSEAGEGDQGEGEAIEADDRAAVTGCEGDGGVHGAACEEPLELGDIVISLETAARQAEDAGTDLEAELLFLASHGLLHLLGWDHPDEPSLNAMLARQEALIRGH